MTQRIALVTGASSGIGKATAELLAKNNYYVFVMARRKDRLEAIRSDNIEPIQLDVTDGKAIEAAVYHAVATKGRIDLLVNNAGYGQLGAIECVSMEAAHEQFEVNVFGYARFMQAVLPHMRSQQAGCIINIASILGRITIPGFGWYAASKHAVEALSETLRSEVMKFGIKVIVIAPGLIKTEFAEKELELLKTVKHPSAYQKLVDALPRLLADEPKAPGPEIIARAVLKAATTSLPPIRHALPGDSKTAVISRWFLGSRLFNWAVRQKMKI
ncbi:MAG TPA: short-chain dehydrogenase/reductase [Nitrosomonas sp.]|uniref:SDR family NAD(P)-dependent oxidoreductase n=1 Tax=Nitrosomonas sp. TaxID=42353 RepID=UPI000E9F899A|nr:SDR family NAD(P)-dependent oxidoreductase [Nitrosomonas sp.]GJL74043.1 MAG: short-chain dehydrogenase/reductase [Nitrosomonas sp.]HBV20999.1 short-chain dehydrogenase/reductase [Nitrosomonas sp.]